VIQIEPVQAFVQVSFDADQLEELGEFLAVGRVVVPVLVDVDVMRLHVEDECSFGHFSRPCLVLQFVGLHFVVRAVTG
jgi:hypothetical protein